MGITTDTFSRRLEHLRRALERPNAPLEVVAALIDALLEGGDRAGALQAYRRYAPRYENGAPQLRTRLRALHERILWNAPETTLQTNVPASRYVMVGREAETYAIAEQLRITPVLCITGAGGVGKTRIALEVARRVLPEYADGVWWVDLSPIEDGAYCAEYVAHILGLTLIDATAEAFAETLASKSCVLVLDRCERVADAVRVLVDDLRKHCTAVRFLLTSRSAIGAAGEHEVRVAPLDLPREDRSDRTTMLSSPAVQLFVERAAAVDPRFGLTEENAGAIGALCRKLGGLPLAIELAASSAGHVPLSHIAQRVDAGHEDIFQTIRWSYDLLDPAAAATLLRLGIFAGPFGFDEAQATSGEQIASSLKRLIDAALVHMRLEGGTPEYYLLDSARDFALARLTGDEAAAVNRRLLSYYARLARGESSGRARLELSFSNIANVLAALSDDADASAEALAVLAAAGIRFGVLGHVDETTRLCESALDNAAADPKHSSAYVDVVRTLAWLRNRKGDFRKAIELARESADLALALDVPRLVVSALSIAYIASINAGDYDAARACSDEALEVARKTEDAAILADALRSAAGSRVAIGDFEASLPLYDELLTLDVERVPQTVLAMAMHDYAIARFSLGNSQVAQTLAQRSAELSAQRRDYSTQADAHNVLGAISLSEGNVEDALQFYRTALHLANRPGLHPITVARTLEGCAASALRDEQLDIAGQILGHSEQMRLRFRAPRNPFERAKGQALHTALESRLGAERFEACLIAGRTKTFGEICGLAARLDAGSAPPEKAERFAGLTNRERVIAELAAGGVSNREISEDLHVSVRTVENHLAAVYRKLGIKTRAEL